jgi:hypothetical protein
MQSPREVVHGLPLGYDTISRGIYTLERRAFATVGLTPPAELALDLVERSLLTTSFAILAAAAFIQGQRGDSATGAIFLAIAIAIALRTGWRSRRRW